MYFRHLYWSQFSFISFLSFIRRWKVEAELWIGGMKDTTATSLVSPEREP